MPTRSAPPGTRSAPPGVYAIAIHGGAGTVPGATLSAEREQRFRAGLAAALDEGFSVLERGGSSLDAVAAAVRILEDDALFNAGRGAALSRDGAAELDAAIMDGRDMRAGAVASVRHVKNPIELARRVMEKSRHVLLVGSGAEEFALEEHFALVPNHYFRTAERVEQLEFEQRGKRVSDLVPPAPQDTVGAVGTVGAVALDVEGNLAAATSTGGMTNKRPGRVGDSPIIGAGTYAKNGVCAVSATGHGEYFIRAVAAHHVCAAVEYRGLTLAQAVHELLHDKLRRLGGDGGLIAVDASGQLILEFTTEGMFRGARHSDGRRDIAIY
jgi:beta-aspartyl-peptidase (threonine type)